MSDETKIFTKNDKNGDKCASGGQESGLKLIFERGVAILVRPWRFPGQPKKFVFFSIKVGTINSGTSLDSREQFKKTGKLEFLNSVVPETPWRFPRELLELSGKIFRCGESADFTDFRGGQIAVVQQFQGIPNRNSLTPGRTQGAGSFRA